MTSEDKFYDLIKKVSLKEYYNSGYCGQGITIASVEGTNDGHGQQVMRVVKTYAPQSTFLSYNDTHEKGALGDTGDYIGLPAFADWCIENKVDIITCSLDWKCDKEEELKAIQKLYDNGIIFFTCAMNSGKEIRHSGTHAYALEDEAVTVSGVYLDDNCNWHWGGWNYGEAVDVVTESYVPYEMPSGGFMSFQATSAATPFMASMIAVLKSTGLKLTSKGIMALIELYSEKFKFEDKEYNLFIMPSLNEVLEKVKEGENMSIKTYSLANDGEKYISKHFQIKEFKSHCNGVVQTDDILIDEKLPSKLEELMTALNSDKAIITSGYRDKQCDIKVGGSGTGQHTLGKAVDIKFYDANNELINSKIVCCKAQDIGFNGIARINDTTTHLDVRTNGKYYGDETKGTNSVTNDFYEYFNIERKESMENNEVSEWAKEAQKYVIEQGISDGSRPKENITREEVWTMIYRISQKN